MHFVVFAVIGFIWSTSFILMKKAAVAFNPVSIAALRVLWGAIVLGWLCWRRGLLKLPDRGLWKWLAVITVAGYAGPYVIQPIVVNHQSTAFMAIGVSCLPLVTIVLSVPMLGVWPTRRQLTGVLIALSCLVMLLWDPAKREVPWYDFVLAGSVPTAYAIANTSMRRWLHDVPTLTLTFYALAITSLTLLPFVETRAGSSWDDRVFAFGTIAVLGIFGTGLAMHWFNQLVRQHGPLFAGMVTNVTPVGAMIWGWLDQESISTAQVVALGGIIASVVLVQFPARARWTSSMSRQ